MNLMTLMKENSIQSLGVIFSNQNTTANVHVVKQDAKKLYKLIENYNFNNLILTCSILQVADTFKPPDWFKEQLMFEASNSTTQENSQEMPNDDLDNDVVLEINSEDSLNNISNDSLVLQLEYKVSLKNGSNLSSSSKERFKPSYASIVGRQV